MTELDEWDELSASIIACRACPRLVSWREQVALTRRRAYREWEYWVKPIPGYGDPQARLVAIGLAPGAHGSNRTGRMFTGDASGDFLYPALHRAGFTNQPLSTSRADGMELKDLFITSLCRCVPPKNKPTPLEIQTCRPWLLAELRLLWNIQGIVALGRTAFEQVLNKFMPSGVAKGDFIFRHGALYQLGENLPWLLASYHPSRQNTQTGRLTREMFDAAWLIAKDRLD